MTLKTNKFFTELHNHIISVDYEGNLIEAKLSNRYKKFLKKTQKQTEKECKRTTKRFIKKKLKFQRALHKRRIKEIKQKGKVLTYEQNRQNDSIDNT